MGDFHGDNGQYVLQSEIPDATLSMQHGTGSSGGDINNRLQELEALKFDSDSLIFADTTLGKGSYGTVVLAYCRNVDGGVAVKRMSFDGDNSKSYRFAREILIMKDFGHHPNILPCYGYTVSPGYIDVVMEYAPFGALSDIVNPSKTFSELPPLLILAWLRDLADALKFMHSHNIKHKDIKAQNILVYRMFQIKLGDFGFAKEHIVNANSTTCGGSFPFMAPEIKDGYQSTLASDIFSFAMTAVQIMTRMTPKAVNFSQRGEQIGGAVAKLQLRFASDDLYSILMRCAQDSPLHRPNAQELCNVMSEILNTNGSDPRDPQNVWFSVVDEMDRRAMTFFRLN
jgi:serine/threonine protein kinase